MALWSIRHILCACAKDAHGVVYSKQIVMNSLFIPKLGENALARIIFNLTSQAIKIMRLAKHRDLWPIYRI